MTKRGLLGAIAAAVLLAGGGAQARDLAADAPYPVEAPDKPAARPLPKKQHDAKQAPAVPLPPAAPRPVTTGALPAEKPAIAAVPVPKPAPDKPQAEAPKLA